MFEPVTGDRPKKPNYNTLVLITDGDDNPTAAPADIPSDVDRVVVVAVGDSPDPSLEALATYPQDFIKAPLACNIKEALKQRLLCEDNKLTVAPNANCTRIILNPGGESGNSTMLGPMAPGP